jgi:hypothetical protein
LKEIYTPDTKKSARLQLRNESNMERAKGILSRRKGKNTGILGLKASKPKNIAMFAKKKKTKKGGSK